MDWWPVREIEIVRNAKDRQRWMVMVTDVLTTGERKGGLYETWI